MRKVFLAGVMTFLSVATAEAQTYSWPYIRQGNDEIFYSQLDNPEVTSTFVLRDGEQISRARTGLYWGVETSGLSMWTGVEMLEPGTYWFSTVEQMRYPNEGFAWPQWEDWSSKESVRNFTWTTTTADDLASAYQLGPNDAAEVISYGVKIGDGVSRMQVFVDHVPDPNDWWSWQFADLVHYSSWTLEDDVLLVPISVIDVRPRDTSESPWALDRSAIFTDLFDGQRNWTLEYTLVPRSEDIFDLTTAYREKIIESELSLGVPRQVRDHMRPDEVLGQCGVQFRMVEYVKLTVPQWVYDGEFTFGVPGDPQCASPISYNNQEIHPEDEICLIPRDTQNPAVACDPYSYLTNLAELGKYYLKWSTLDKPPSAGKGDVNSAGEVVSGDYLGLPVIFTGGLNKGIGPNCNINTDFKYEGLTVGREVVGVFEHSAQPNTLAHELYHVVSGRNGHNLNPGTLMAAMGGATNTWIPGCSQWRTDGQTPYGCNVAQDQAANLANYTETCSALRNGIDEFGNLPPPPTPSWADMEYKEFGLKSWSYGRWSLAQPAIFSSLSSTLGNYALEVPLGYTEIVSPSFNTAEWGTVGDKLLLDVKMPAELNNPYWAGNIAVRFENPATGTYVMLGQRELNLAPLGEWSTLEYDVPEDVQQVLLGDYPAGVFIIVTNTNDGAAQGQLIDSLRFGGNVVSRSTPHQPNSSQMLVQTNSFLDFEDIDEWLSNSDTFAVTDTILSGLSALGLDAVVGWNEVESRTFATAELPDPTDTISLDLYIPTPQPNPWWTGAVQLFLTCEDAEFYNQMIGQVELQNLFQSEYNQLKFSLSEQTRAILLDDYFDCRFKITLNSSSTAGKFLFDRMGYIE